MWRVFKQLVVFGCFILLVFLVFNSRPTSLFEPPLFNPARGFGVAVLLFFGFRVFLIPLYVAGIFCNFYFLKYSFVLSLIYASTTLTTLSLLVFITKRICKGINPSQTPRDWVIFLVLIVPITSTLRFLLDNILLLVTGHNITAIWARNYIDWMLVDLLGVILVCPFFMELFEALQKRRGLWEFKKDFFPTIVGNFMGSIVFFNPNLEKMKLPQHSPFYIALLGVIGLAYFASPLFLAFSVFFQGMWAAWGRDGAILAGGSNSIESLWNLRVFLFVMGILTPILSNLFEKKSEDNFKKSFDLVNSALDPSNTENEIIRLASKSDAVGVGVFDLDQRLLHLNEKFAAITGEPLESQIGKSSRERLGPNSGHVSEIFERVYKTGRPIWNYPVRLKAWKGINEHNILANYLPIFSKDGRVVGVVVVTTDSPKKDETGEFSKPEDFGMAFSHDVQEPLRNIEQAIKILNEKFSVSSDVEIKTFLQSAMDASSRAQLMMRSSIDLSRLAYNSENLVPLSMEELVTDVLGHYKNELNNVESMVKLGNLPKVKGEKVLLTRLIQNIISNAIKYRSEKPLEIKLSATVNGKWCEFCFSDNGIGFPIGEAERIFAPFQRLHTGREISGDGIGLSICRKIVSLHGGKMWAESQEHQGAQFYFTLPVA